MARIKPCGREVTYHCVSRIVGGQYLLGDVEKEAFRRLMWAQAAFCGVDIMGYCIMSNHVHLLVRVPCESKLDDRLLVNRVSTFYGANDALSKRLTMLRDANEPIPVELKDQLLARMGDISVFNKELKQRFSAWYNRTQGRFGTLWAERFRSTIVEGVAETMLIVSAYIDLNPVRAGIVKDPKDYRFCGYAEALGGRDQCRKAIMSLYPCGPWRQISSRYREFLFLKGGMPGHSQKRMMDRDEILRELDRGAKLSAGHLLRLRIRYFSDGLALGATPFVEELYREFQDRFSEQRKSGARSLNSALSNLGFVSLRELKKKPFS